ncbi:MAG TPA: tRNA (adenosine(37)-N6)-threonylcarbamoyltransferase complex dimerization subunit type 1 TsaB [Woeseiaceae bacterium]|nr:tRNA (adenosine(37)-N6)-threonylcarbamoyltransferase complex dimerization subunit type 1 TsaB [Woeseiaceae bacterium]
MKLLALDTSTVACSAALALGDAVMERHEVRPKEHTRLLVPMLRELLAEGGVAPADLDAVVLGNGPGSFIGLRIGASVAQGICYAAGLKLVPVSSLAAVAAEALELGGAARVVVAQDAHMNEVYLGTFRRGEDGLPVPESEAVLQPVAAIEALPGGASADGRHAAGEGWRRYPELLALNEHRFAGILDVNWPRARYLLELGRRACQAGAAIEPAALVPEYVRQRVAA